MIQEARCYFEERERGDKKEKTRKGEKKKGERMAFSLLFSLFFADLGRLSRKITRENEESGIYSTDANANKIKRKSSSLSFLSPSPQKNLNPSPPSPPPPSLLFSFPPSPDLEPFLKKHNPLLPPSPSTPKKKRPGKKEKFQVLTFLLKGGREGGGTGGGVAKESM